MTDNFPRLFRVRQNFPRPALSDIPAEIMAQVRALNLNVRKGATVAVACPSRGLAAFPDLVRGTVAALKELGLSPFLVPAMGSHGSGTAEGQERVLVEYGLTEDKVGAPIRSQLDVVEIGRTPQGIPVYLDKLAHGADYLVILNRVKKHTDFEGEIESGLMKICGIGLGKLAGATMYHQAMMTHGPVTMIRDIAQTLVANTNFLFGVGSVENAYLDVAEVKVLTGPNLLEGEKELLKASKKLSPKLPFDEGHILWIDETGKDISGSGIDTKVIGRISAPLFSPDPASPRFRRIMVSDITAASHGNTGGLAQADLVSRRLFDKIDREANDLNIITSCVLEMGKIPPVAENDREAFKILMRSVGLVEPQDIRYMRIKNTLRLVEVELSEPYYALARGRDDLTIISEPAPPVFDAQGYFPEF
ncbi:nickel-dependent lactate racemase [Deltaproteobacteria bacterium OttesenSCG-928-M10]|nr:nickel-dependent lactate racemase [Deltaproteobacteria bacterium OttesenSCG-928-M10]